ncbi:MAG: DNA primase, partial [Chloroflexi bacterium]|nr:DNA primase [Chloroflexota bacterium]
MISSHPITKKSAQSAVHTTRRKLPFRPQKTPLLSSKPRLYFLTHKRASTLREHQDTTFRSSQTGDGRCRQPVRQWRGEQMTLVDEVKARLTIVDVVSDYVALENLSSRTPKALCPFHDERTPSFSISLEHDSWRCWGACGVGGGMFDFVMRADGIEFKEALEKLALKAGIEPNFKDEHSDNRRRSRSAALHEVNQIAEDFFTRQLEGTQGQEALAYLESRGIDAQTARRRGIGYAPGGVNSLIAYLKSIAADSQAVVQSGLVVKGNDDTWRDMFTNRITIAIRDPRGNVIGFGARAMNDAQPKYLNTHETSIFNKSKILYGMHWASDAIRASGRAIVVEGYMDVIAAQERGFKNVVACMGTAVTSQQLQTISTFLPDDPDNPPSIVLCLDADEAGQQATLRGLQVALSEFGRRTTTQANSRRAPIDIRIASPVVSEHGEAKDPDEAIRNNGAEWIASIDQADEIIDFVIRTSLSSHNTATENGLDVALNEVEPYFENIPPHTIREQRKLSGLGEQLGIAVDDMIHVLTRKRSARETVQNTSNSDNNSRRNPTRRTGTTRPAIPVATAAIQARWESDLLACMLQYDYAIDHAANVEPYHFTDPVRRRVF